MSLINIEYGSIASSDTMNKNFTYLDNKITETANSIMTTISSMLSGIATINSRLGEISEDIADVDADLGTFKTNIVNMIKTITMLPAWTNMVGIALPYTVKVNGYILVLPSGGVSNGDLVINGKTIPFKKANDRYDGAIQMVTIPVKAGDVVSCTSTLLGSYFLPAVEVSYEQDNENN